ncbi:hypothetical protein RUM43_003034 [Polyplax serrata]|uniref:Uncharacterized protein n=1 Tax=Polyplax serrata TaxID=468196 RepID=A0AAN8PN78_POLSC
MCHILKLQVTIFVFVISTCIVNASLLEPVVENVVHINASYSTHGVPGTWRKKTIWKPRWVKEWKSAKVMKPTWKKVWSPVLIQEWIPFPKPPPQKWKTKSTPLLQLTVEQDGKLPLWDPMPYPESQQPPPAPAPPGPPGPPNFRNNGQTNCNKHGCDGGPPSTFTHDQISEILGHNRYKKATDISKDSKQTDSASSEIWRSRRQSPFSFLANSPFNIFPQLSQFLVPPKFQAMRSNDVNHHPRPNRPLQPIQNARKPIGRNQAGHTVGQNQIRPPNGQRHPHPPPTVNQPLNHMNKFQAPNNHVRPNNIHGEKQKFDMATSTKLHAVKGQQNSTSLNTGVKSNFIQPAELVGEYHYVTEYEFNTAIKPEPNFEEVKFKPLPSSMWSLSSTVNTSNSGLKDQTVKPEVDHFMSDSKGRPRPIRKDVETSLTNDLADSLVYKHRVTPKPPPGSFTSVFEQEQAITKEIFPLFDNKSKTLPSNDRAQPHKVPSQVHDSSTQASATTPITITGNDLSPPRQETATKSVEKNHEHNEKPNEDGLRPVRLSEEVLLKAIQNGGVLPTDQSATQYYPPITSSSSDFSSTTTSPVYIVTPIYQNKSN